MDQEQIKDYIGRINTFRGFGKRYGNIGKQVRKKVEEDERSEQGNLMDLRGTRWYERYSSFLYLLRSSSDLIDVEELTEDLERLRHDQDSRYEPGFPNNSFGLLEDEIGEDVDELEEAWESKINQLEEEVDDILWTLPGLVEEKKEEEMELVGELLKEYGLDSYSERSEYKVKSRDRSESADLERLDPQVKIAVEDEDATLELNLWTENEEVKSEYEVRMSDLDLDDLDGVQVLYDIMCNVPSLDSATMREVPLDLEDHREGGFPESKALAMSKQKYQTKESEVAKKLFEQGDAVYNLLENSKFQRAFKLYKWGFGEGKLDEDSRSEWLLKELYDEDAERVFEKEREEYDQLVTELGRDLLE